MARIIAIGEQLRPEPQQRSEGSEPLPEGLPDRESVGDRVQGLAIGGLDFDSRHVRGGEARGGLPVTAGRERDDPAHDLRRTGVLVRAPDGAGCEVADRIDDLHVAGEDAVARLGRPEPRDHAGPGPGHQVMGEGPGSVGDHLEHRRAAGAEPPVDEGGQHVRGAELESGLAKIPGDEGGTAPARVVRLGEPERRGVQIIVRACAKQGSVARGVPAGSAHPSSQSRPLVPGPPGSGPAGGGAGS